MQLKGVEHEPGIILSKTCPFEFLTHRLHLAWLAVMCSHQFVTMAQGEPAGFGYWIGVLVDACGLPLREEVPREKRPLFRKLARFLVENEFEHVSQLRNGEQHLGSSMSHCVVMLCLCRM